MLVIVGTIAPIVAQQPHRPYATDRVHAEAIAEGRVEGEPRNGHEHDRGSGVCVLELTWAKGRGKIPARPSEKSTRVVAFIAATPTANMLFVSSSSMISGPITPNARVPGEA